MPHETVTEKVVRQRKIRVCARCRREIPETVNRNAYRTVGGISGSLGASIGGSMLAGAVLGPVGAIGGAIAGSIMGGRAGAQASDKVCDVVSDKKGDSYCDACRNADFLAQDKWGSGSKLGDGRNYNNGNIDTPNYSAGERVQRVTSDAGEKLNQGLSWISQKAASVRRGKQQQGMNEQQPRQETGGFRLGDGATDQQQSKRESRWL